MRIPCWIVLGFEGVLFHLGDQVHQYRMEAQLNSIADGQSLVNNMFTDEYHGFETKTVALSPHH